MATPDCGISVCGKGTRRVVIDIEGEAAAANSEDAKERWKKHSIYMVPSYIKRLNRDAYQPRVVSFGPYHHGEKDLAPMEQHKNRSFCHYLKRYPRRSQSSLEVELKKVEPQLMDAYEGLNSKWRGDPERFLKLMITDGCFTLEIMRCTNELKSPTAEGPKFKDYDINDPIFSAHGVLNVVPYIMRDMLMVENQLPLLVLAILVALETTDEPIYPVDDTIRDAVHKMVLKFLAPSHPPIPMTALGLHALDVFRRKLVTYQGPAPNSTNKSDVKRKKRTDAEADIIRSAVELNEAGIHLKKSKSKSKCLMGIQFSRGVLSRGVLILPELVVDDLTKYMLLNLMAFERIHVGAGNDVTSYVFFMDKIIDSSKDVSLLVSKGIIQNALGSDKAVAHLFNSLSRDVTLDPQSPLNKVHEQVSEYCGKSWNKWRANLLHTYFRNPWAFLSLAAAIFLLVLTVAQTVFTILQWRQGFSKDATPRPPPFLAPSLSPSIH